MLDRFRYFSLFFPHFPDPPVGRKASLGEKNGNPGYPPTFV
jgi:hypothetical protein